MDGEQSNFDLFGPEQNSNTGAEGGSVLTPEGFAERLTGGLGENVSSIILHGPAAVGVAKGEPPEYNLVVVLGELGVDELDQVAPLVREWVGGGQPMPLFFSERRLAHSASAFPVEILDLKESNRVLHGRDTFSSLEIGKDDLLREIERGLKIMSMRLSDLRLLADGSGDKLRAALRWHLPRVNLLLRSVLRLYTPQSPGGMVECVRKLEINLPGTSPGLLGLYAWVWEKDAVAGTSAAADGKEFFERILASLRALIFGVEGQRRKREEAD